MSVRFTSSTYQCLCFITVNILALSSLYFSTTATVYLVFFHVPVSLRCVWGVKTSYQCFSAFFVPRPITAAHSNPTTLIWNSNKANVIQSCVHEVSTRDPFEWFTTSLGGRETRLKPLLYTIQRLHCRKNLNWVSSDAGVDKWCSVISA